MTATCNFADGYSHNTSLLSFRQSLHELFRTRLSRIQSYLASYPSAVPSENRSSVGDRVCTSEKNGVIYGVLAGRQYRPQTPATFVGGCGNPYKHHSRDKHASPPRLQAIAPCCSCMYLLLPKHPKDWSSLAQGQPKEGGGGVILCV